MIRRERYQVASLLVSAGMLLAASGGACLPQPSGDDGPDSEVEKAIGATGGAVEATNRRGDTIRLELPAGALSNTVTIVLQPLESAPANPIATNVFPGVDIRPEGLKLLKPAALRITLAGGPVDSRSLLFRLRGSDLVMPLGRQEIASNTISGQLRHFSTYLGGSPSDAEAAQQSASVGGESADPSDWQGILDNIGGMMQWGEWLQSHGLEGEAQQQYDQAEQALSRATECFLDPGCRIVPIDICDENYVREGLALLAQAQLLGFDEESELMQNLNAAVTHLLNECTNRFEIEYDYVQSINYGEFSEDIHVTGRVPFSLPVYVVSDVEPQQATGGGTVSGAITGAAGDCVITGSFTVDVVVEGQLEADGLGRPLLNLRLHESWYVTGRQTITCEDGSSDVPLPPLESTQPVQLLMQDGYVLEQPHIETRGHYRWTLHVLHLW